MPRYIALIRAINVAGHRVAMADLRALFARAGFTDVQSLLQSGNLVFQTARRSTARLEEILEREAAARLRLHTDFFVRTVAEWSAMVGKNPFPAEAKSDPGHLLVMFLKAPPKPGAVEALQAAIVGRERVRATGREAFIVYPDGVGRSRLTNALIEKTLGTRSTGRNWNTVLKLGALTT